MSLKEKYVKTVVPRLQSERGYKNLHQVPKIVKVSLNSGFPEDKNWAPELLENLSLIAGQKAVLTKARKSIANFKLREGMAIGAKVTLRGNRMYDFLCRLLDVVLPLERDFRGISSRAFDGNGNYNMGLKDCSIFPEVKLEKKTFGIDIAVVTTAQNDEEAKLLLSYMGFPFRKI